MWEVLFVWALCSPGQAVPEVPVGPRQWFSERKVSAEPPATVTITPSLKPGRHTIRRRYATPAFYVSC